MMLGHSRPHVFRLHLYRLSYILVVWAKQNYKIAKVAHTTPHAGGGSAMGSGKRLQKELAQKLFVFVLERRLQLGLQLHHHDVLE